MARDQTISSWSRNETKRQSQHVGNKIYFAMHIAFDVYQRYELARRLSS